MSLHPGPTGEIPAETARIARAAFPKGAVVTRLRDEFSALRRDEDFGGLYPGRGQPALTPWRLALVTAFQSLESLSDRQAADAVRARIDWKYALGLELTDPGFHFGVLSEFRARLVGGDAEHLLPDRMLERLKARGLVEARGKQRTGSTHALAAVHDLHLLGLAGETLRAALDDLAAVVPDRLRTVAPAAWFERYARRIEEYRLPGGRGAGEALALEIGADGVLPLEALDAPDTPAAARGVPMARTLREVWRVHHARGDDGRLRWREVEGLPPVAERMQSPHGPGAHFSMKRRLAWTGYKAHATGARGDDAAHLVTHVTTRPAMRPDMTSTAGIHGRLAAKGLLPAEHVVDSARVDAGLLAGSRRDHGVPLEGPVRGTASRPARAGRGYGLPRSAIDWDRERVTRPLGKTSASWRRETVRGGETRTCAQFSRSDCGPCAAGAPCAPATAARRPVHFHAREGYEALNAARARTSDPAWQERYRRRAGVEGTLSRAVRASGMRRSRHIGLAKTALQQVGIAVGMNVSRVVHWLDGLPRARTRVTRFAALARAA
jgi:transposase